MADCLLYFDKQGVGKNMEEKFSGGYTVLHPDSKKYFLWSTIHAKDYIKYRSDRYQFIVIGNCSYYKNFKLEIDTFFSSEINVSHILHLIKKINGIYCCFIEDLLGDKVYIITDPLGFFPLYIYEDHQRMILTSELKFLHKVPEIPLHADEESIRLYMQNGHLMLGKSWYKEVKRTRPGSCYTIDTAKNTISRLSYWNWSFIQKNKGSKEELQNKYTTLFLNSVNELDISSENYIGLSLSGGLDSRWIAHIASQKWKLHPFSFSDSQNYELKLAEKVSQTLNLAHTHYKIDPENWLKNRIASFWKTDGMLHLGHLHEGSIPQTYYSKYSHCFHGFFGGGIYASSNECNRRITDSIANNHFSGLSKETQTEDPFYDLNCIDPYIIDQKIRYQSAYSMYLLANYTKMVLPFYNLDWLTFNYSIDDTLQCYQQFYLEALNKNLKPELRSIPWQKTALSPCKISLNTFFLKYRIPALLESGFQFFKSSRHFINYATFDAELNYWIQKFSSDISNLQLNYPLHSREQKHRMLSLLLIQKMLSKNSPDVL